MDISDIELVRTLVETGSLSEASEQLNQSQPTLSRKLSRLEDQLKVQLFHRSSKGLTPTELAAYILTKAEPLDQKLREIERHLELVTDFGIGNLNLGVGSIIEQILLPDVLKRFTESTGDVTLSVVTEDDATLLSLFEKSSLDLIVGPFYAKEQKSKDLVVLPMIKDDIIAVARQHHPVLRNKKIDAHALSQYSWTAPKKQGAAKLAKGGPSLPGPKIHSDNYDLHKKLMLSTDMLCAAPRAVFKDEINRNLLKEVNVDLRITWESALIVRSETMLAPLARHLVSLFEEESKAANAP